MLTENATPFAGIGFEQWHRDGPTMAVIAMRRRFWFELGAPMAALARPELALSDRFAGDPQTSDLLTASDLVPFKPATDITVRGTLHAVKPQAHILAGLQIGRHIAILRATGPRAWVYDRNRWRLTESAPAQTAPLSYRAASGERVIGDPEAGVDPRNPIGPSLVDPDHTPREREIEAATINSERASVRRLTGALRKARSPLCATFV